MNDQDAGAIGNADQGSAGDAIAAASTRVRQLLEPFGDVEVERGDDGVPGRCTLRYGSALVAVEIGVFDEDQAAVHVRSRCVTGATRSPELYHWVATNRTEIGAFHVIDEADGTATIEFSRTLLAEFLNPAELRLTVVAVAFNADRFDDQLASRFGGMVHDAAGNNADTAPA
jgi:hypothetical protein